jgi:hypothetical protein
MGRKLVKKEEGAHSVDPQVALFSQGALSNFITANSIFPQLALKVYGVRFPFTFTGLDV